MTKRSHAQSVRYLGKSMTGSRMYLKGYGCQGFCSGTKRPYARSFWSVKLRRSGVKCNQCRLSRMYCHRFEAWLWIMVLTKTPIHPPAFVTPTFSVHSPAARRMKVVNRKKKTAESATEERREAIQRMKVTRNQVMS